MSAALRKIISLNEEVKIYIDLLNFTFGKLPGGSEGYFGTVFVRRASANSILLRTG